MLEDVVTRRGSKRSESCGVNEREVETSRFVRFRFCLSCTEFSRSGTYGLVTDTWTDIERDHSKEAVSEI